MQMERAQFESVQNNNQFEPMQMERRQFENNNNQQNEPGQGDQNGNRMMASYFILNMREPSDFMQYMKREWPHHLQDYLTLLHCANLKHYCFILVCLAFIYWV